MISAAHGSDREAYKVVIETPKWESLSHQIVLELGETSPALSSQESAGGGQEKRNRGPQPGNREHRQSQRWSRQNI